MFAHFFWLFLTLPLTSSCPSNIQIICIISDADTSLPIFFQSLFDIASHLSVPVWALESPWHLRHLAPSISVIKLICMTSLCGCVYLKRKIASFFRCELANINETLSIHFSVRLSIVASNRFTYLLLKYAPNDRKCMRMLGVQGA